VRQRQVIEVIHICKGNSMKVAINARDSVGAHRGGIGRYAINLLETLAAPSFSRRITLSAFLSKTDIGRDRRARELTENPNLDTISLPSSNPTAKLYFDHLSIIKHLDERNSDILHCLKFVLPLAKTIPGNIKKVVTVHDLIFLDRPKLFPFATREYWKRAVKRSVKLADAIIVPSGYTKEQVSSAYGERMAEKCRVIHHGLDPVFDHNDVKAGKKTNERDFHGYGHQSGKAFFLCVGTIEPRKNLKNIIRAFETFTAKDPLDNTDMVWVGKMGWEKRALFDLIRERGLTKRIVFLHDVDDESLADLYRHAIALVYPSLSEGFGLPVLEAMGSGCPVIHSGRGALAEVADRHQLRIEPTDPHSIAEAMIGLKDNDELRKDIIAYGLKSAKKFSWKAAGKKVLKVYEDL